MLATRLTAGATRRSAALCTCNASRQAPRAAAPPRTTGSLKVRRHSSLIGSQLTNGSNSAQTWLRRYSTRRGEAAEPLVVEGKSYPRDEFTNVTPTILSKLPRQLHLQPSHPIGILRRQIESHFNSFEHLNSLSPIVTVQQNFDDLGFPPDHPGRALTDSYYLNKEYMLRTHTSAHEVESFRKGLDRFLLSADVYRRDEIDRSHYPVFHQMEGCNVVDPSEGGIERLERENAEMRAALSAANIIIDDPTGPETATNPYQPEHDPRVAKIIAEHLKNSLNGLVLKLFGPNAAKAGEPLQVRWIEATFPWTAPSYEVEVLFNGKWLEILGCGVVKQDALARSGELVADLHHSFAESAEARRFLGDELTSSGALKLQVSRTSKVGRLDLASNGSPWSCSRSPTSASSGPKTSGSCPSSARTRSRPSSRTPSIPSATRIWRSGCRSGVVRRRRRSGKSGTRMTLWRWSGTRRAISSKVFSS